MTFAELRSTSAAPMEGRLPRVLVDVVTYGLVSVLALTSDCASLYLLVWAGLHYIAASTLSFLVGMSVCYALSARFVFADRRGASRKSEVIGFVAVGVAGLLLTQVLLYVLVSRLGVLLALAKAATVGIVFVFNFLGRRYLVFVGPNAT